MQRYLRNIDWWLVGAVCALVGIGLMLIASATHSYAVARGEAWFVERQGIFFPVWQQYCAAQRPGRSNSRNSIYVLQPPFLCGRAFCLPCRPGCDRYHGSQEKGNWRGSGSAYPNGPFSGPQRD